MSLKGASESANFDWGNKIKCRGSTKDYFIWNFLSMLSYNLINVYVPIECDGVHWILLVKFGLFIFWEAGIGLEKKPILKIHVMVTMITVYSVFMATPGKKKTQTLLKTKN